MRMGAFASVVIRKWAASRAMRCALIGLVASSCIGHWGHERSVRRPLSQHASPMTLRAFDARITDHLPGFWILGVDLESSSCERQVATRASIVTTERWRPGSVMAQVFVGLAGVASGVLLLMSDDDYQTLGYLTLGASGVYLAWPIASLFPRSRTQVSTEEGSVTETVSCGDLLAPHRFRLETPWGSVVTALPGCRSGYCLRGTTGDFYFEYDVSALKGLQGQELRERIRGSGRWSIVHDSGVARHFDHPDQMIQAIERQLTRPEYDVP